jgi:hypothetical protein
VTAALAKKQPSEESSIEGAEKCVIGNDGINLKGDSNVGLDHEQTQAYSSSRFILKAS